MVYPDWTQLHPYILKLEEEGLVTRTFRRLDPQRQQAILDAILTEAALNGPADLNIKQVAKRAGVSVGSLYTYFPHRDGMLDFAIELSVRYICDLFKMYAPYLVDLPLREALSGYLVGGVEWSRTQVGFLRLFARAAYQGDTGLADRLVRPVATAAREIVQEIFSRAMARGEVREDIDLQATARVVHALTIAIGDSQLLPYLNEYFQAVGEEVTIERTLQSMLDLITSGVQPQTRPE